MCELLLVKVSFYLFVLQETSVKATNDRTGSESLATVSSLPRDVPLQTAAAPDLFCTTNGRSVSRPQTSSPFVMPPAYPLVFSRNNGHSSTAHQHFTTTTPMSTSDAGNRLSVLNDPFVTCKNPLDARRNRLPNITSAQMSDGAGLEGATDHRKNSEYEECSSGSDVVDATYDLPFTSDHPRPSKSFGDPFVVTGLSASDPLSNNEQHRSALRSRLPSIQTNVSDADGLMPDEGAAKTRAKKKRRSKAAAAAAGLDGTNDVDASNNVPLEDVINRQTSSSAEMSSSAVPTTTYDSFLVAQ